MFIVAQSQSSIAWFSLWSLLQKGDQQRALSMQRLLMHTFNDEAFSLLVEAEIALYIGLSNALELLQAAAALYLHRHEYEKACSLYERLLVINPQEQLYIDKLNFLYSALNSPARLSFFIACNIQHQAVHTALAHVLLASITANANSSPSPYVVVGQ